MPLSTYPLSFWSGSPFPLRILTPFADTRRIRSTIHVYIYACTQTPCRNAVRARWRSLASWKVRFNHELQILSEWLDCHTIRFLCNVAAKSPNMSALKLFMSSVFAKYLILFSVLFYRKHKDISRNSSAEMAIFLFELPKHMYLTL